MVFSRPCPAFGRPHLPQWLGLQMALRFRLLAILQSHWPPRCDLSLFEFRVILLLVKDFLRRQTDWAVHHPRFSMHIINTRFSLCLVTPFCGPFEPPTLEPRSALQSIRRRYGVGGSSRNTLPSISQCISTPEKKPHGRFSLPSVVKWRNFNRAGPTLANLRQETLPFGKVRAQSQRRPVFGCTANTGHHG